MIFSKKYIFPLTPPERFCMGIPYLFFCFWVYNKKRYKEIKSFGDISGFCSLVQATLNTTVTSTLVYVGNLLLPYKPRSVTIVYIHSYNKCQTPSPLFLK